MNKATETATKRINDIRAMMQEMAAKLDEIEAVTNDGDMSWAHSANLASCERTIADAASTIGI